MVSTAQRRMIERSAALASSAPPRSARCAAMMSLHLRTHGLRPSTPSSGRRPFVSAECWRLAYARANQLTTYALQERSCCHLINRNWTLPEFGTGRDSVTVIWRER